MDLMKEMKVGLLVLSRCCQGSKEENERDGIVVKYAKARKKR